MQVCRTINELRLARSHLEGTVGLVPTMGALHEGHLSLVEASQTQNEHTVVTIFVNPVQFTNAADLATYPRDEAYDLALLSAANVTLAFLPDAADIYPEGFDTRVDVGQVAEGLEGVHRPGHFNGVAVVICKLFNLVQPSRAYFGRKDAQQVAVIQQLTRDLNFPVEIIACPTQRDDDGLAMSSRNRRLSPEGRKAASVIYRALMAAQALYDKGERQPENLSQAVMNMLRTEPMVGYIDYVSAVSAVTLQPLPGSSSHPILLSLAVMLDGVRLIDNLVLGDQSLASHTGGRLNS